jgi:glycosyltransferase 2 family protein
MAWAKRVLTIVVLAVLGIAIVIRARSVNWPEVLDALRGFGTAKILIAVAITVPAQLACAGYDLISRHVTGHTVRASRVMLISYTGYYFSLNLGGLLGGVAFRYRLYMPYRLSTLTVTQIIALTLVTNWSGYVLLTGALLAYDPLMLPASWHIGMTALRSIGITLVALTVAYVLACAWHGGKRVKLRTTELRVPGAATAAIQLLLSLTSWGAIGAIVSWLLPGSSWVEVTQAMLLASFVALWAHIPSGLGVIELALLAMLGDRISEGDLLAALLVFRAVYYLVPFVVSLAFFLYLETTARIQRAPPASSAPPES